MSDLLDVSGFRKMRVGQDVVNAVHACCGNICVLQKHKPLPSASCSKDFAEKAVDVVNVLEALALAAEAHVLREYLGLANGIEEATPMLVVVHQDADMAIACLVGSAITCETTLISGRSRRRPIEVPGKVLPKNTMTWEPLVGFFFLQIFL